MEQSKTGRRRNIVLLAAAAIAVLAIIGFGLKSLLTGSGSAHHKPPKISLLPATPPPPPPPPKEEKKPEPPKEQKEIKMEQPEPKLAPAPDNTLKMEGDKGSGPSEFQSGNVVRENYIPGSDRGNPYALYSNFMQKFLQDELARNKALAGKEYRVSVMLWLDNGGRIEKISLTQSSGNPHTDALLRTALAEMPPLKAPPENMPRPVGVRISSRG